MLLPKLEDLSDEVPIDNLFQDFTANVGSYLNVRAEGNNIWEKSQLGICSGVLRTVDQLVVDNTIMDDVRGKSETLLLHSMITARHKVWSDMTGCYQFIDGWRCEKNGECAKPTLVGMEKKVRDR